MGDQEHADDDAPLDFSIKRSSPGVPEDLTSTAAERPGVLRSPELGQTAVHPSRVRHNGLGSIGDKPAEVITIKPEEKIGEPQLAMPGFLPGTTVPSSGGTAALPAYTPSGLLSNLAAMQGMISGSPRPSMASLGQKKHPQIHQQDKGGNTRPFKAYPKEPLSLPLGYFGMPGMNPFPGLDNSNNQMMQANSEEMFKQYRDYVIKLQEQQHQQLQKTGGGVPLDKSPPLHRDTSSKLPSSPTNVSSTSSSNGGSVPNSPSAYSPAISMNSPPSSSSTVSTTTSAGKRKRLVSMPDEQKDQAYWERRRKNNDAAKRSRDARRAKEDEIAIRAAFLEQENLKLRVEVTSLKNETAKLRCMLYNS